MKKLLLLLCLLAFPLFANDHVAELNKMAGRKVTITFRYYDKVITGDLKETNSDGIVVYVDGNERLFIFYDAIASIQEQKKFK